MNAPQSPRKFLLPLVYGLLFFVGPKSFAEFRPRADFELTQQLYIGLSERIDLSDTVVTILANIDPQIKINIVAPDLTSLQQTQTKWLFSPHYHKDLRITWHNLNTSDVLWLRDYLPYPLVTSDRSAAISHFPTLKTFSYFQPETQLKALNKIFNNNIQKLSPVFEHGNLVSSHRGDCFSIPMPDLGELGRVPEAELLKDFGCRSLTLLPFERGIGHADERVLFINEVLALTDSEPVEKILATKGYQVLRLPKAPLGDRSYVNAIIINHQVFIPEFDTPEDIEAFKIFQKTGLKVIGVPSRELTDTGGGSLHCITRTY